MRWDYERLKSTARELGTQVRKLYVNDKMADPFFISPNRKSMADWFVELWKEYGGPGTHLRRVHYRMLSASPPIIRPMVNKPADEYRNDGKCWNYLVNASKYARYLGLIPYDEIIDRRTPEPNVEFIPSARVTGYRVSAEVGAEPLPELPDADSFPDIPSAMLYENKDLRPCLMEVWIEKQEAIDVILPICEKHEVNLITGMGNMSLSSAQSFIKRVQEADLPARIFYISDYDTQGKHMPFGVARKIEYMLRDEGLGLDIGLQPIVLLLEQIKEYNLPTSPDSKDVELNALEALYPGELGRLVEENIKRYDFPEWRKEYREAYFTLKNRLDELDQKVLETPDDLGITYSDKWANLRRKYDSLMLEFEDRLSSLDHEIYDLQDEIIDKFEGQDLDEIKESKQYDYTLDDPENLLFHSGRDYLEQMDFYNDWKAIQGIKIRL